MRAIIRALIAGSVASMSVAAQAHTLLHCESIERPDQTPAVVELVHDHATNGMVAVYPARAGEGERRVDGCSGALETGVSCAAAGTSVWFHRNAAPTPVVVLREEVAADPDTTVRAFSCWSPH
jgi:hypothetical protein